MQTRGTINRDELRTVFENLIPFNRLLGLRVVEVGDGQAEIEVPFQQAFIGNPLLKSLHGGVISALLDTCGGLAVWSQIQPDDMVSTVDLRVDYLRPGEQLALIASGRVVRLGNRVGVVDLLAFHPRRRAEPVAAGTGVYSIRRSDGDGNVEVWRRLIALANSQREA